MKVFVLRYCHKHGNDISVYATEELAKNAVEDIADQWWDIEIPERVKKPKSPGELSMVYWDIMADRGEFYEIEEREVVGI